MDATRIGVSAPDGAYDIVIERGLLAQLGNRADEFGLSGRVIVATNTTLAPLYGEVLAQRLPNAALVTMPDGEMYKTLDTVRDVYAELVRLGADRHTKLIALGGGVVGDTMGFVAATYMRGVSFVQIPTSLLAMVDASVGGKVGVDLPQGKNLIGAFKQPEVVLMDADVLMTLPEREWRCGMAEVIKHGLLADEGLLEPSLYVLERAAELIARAVRVKVDVVMRDPYERNIRAYLNLGHTFAHAIEQVSGYVWGHGEAVGVGLIAALRLSHELGMCDADLVTRIEALLSEVGLPTRLGGLEPRALYGAMSTDKKWRDGRSRFVLLRGIGRVEVVEGVASERVLDVLAQLS